MVEILAWSLSLGSPAMLSTTHFLWPMIWNHSLSYLETLPGVAPGTIKQ